MPFATLGSCLTCNPKVAFYHLTSLGLAATSVSISSSSPTQYTDIRTPVPSPSSLDIWKSGNRYCSHDEPNDVALLLTQPATTKSTSPVTSIIIKAPKKPKFIKVLKLL